MHAQYLNPDSGNTTARTLTKRSTSAPHSYVSSSIARQLPGYAETERWDQMTFGFSQKVFDKGEIILREKYFPRLSAVKQL